MSETVIKLQGISKSFLTEDLETRALDEVSLDIKRGEFVAITGPSGCGKSTLMGILGLLDTATGGSYELAGKAVEKLDRHERARMRNREIGFVFQAFNLISDLTVAENVGLPLEYRADISKAERLERVNQALARVDMSHRAGHFPAQLSGGQQQRVAVARALVGKPALILADEPTGNLDSRNAELVMELLNQIHAAGATLCMVTHDPRSAALAQRTISLFDGRVVEDRNNDTNPVRPSPILAGVK